MKYQNVPHVSEGRRIRTEGTRLYCTWHRRYLPAYAVACVLCDLEGHTNEWKPN